MKTLHFSMMIVGVMFVTVLGLGISFIDAGAISPTNETQFQLKVNQTFSMESDGIKVKLLNVTSDSRCPSDVTCIWQGEVKVLTNIIENNQDRGNFNLSTLAGHDQIVFGKYIMHLLQVSPLAKSTKKISVSDYVISFEISSAYVKPPLKQFKSGVAASNVTCNQNLELIFKAKDGTPACVTQKTAQRLIQLNWGVLSPVQSKPAAQSQENIDNKFAFSFFSQVSSQDKGNIFFSPYSISDAFSMVYEGANGSTKDQIQSVFGFIQDDAQRRNLIKSQNEQLTSTDKYQLNTANALWIQNDYHILPTYTDTLQNYYKTELTSLDLKNDSENSRNTINKWVEDKTNQKIIDLLPPGSIDQSTRAVLTNAIYFKANWTSQFTPENTSDQNFTTGQNTQVKVPMMSQFATFPYYEDSTAQVLDMPYQGDRLSMIVILPKANMQSLGSISQEQFNDWKDKLADTPVKVYMPKFKIDRKYTLNDILGSMGIKDAFDPNIADFSGITGNHDLSISAAVHQAYVKVDERGTEAAAATGAVFQTTSMPIYQQTFRADHPFVFMIYDKQTNLILFLGKITDPTA